MAHAQWGSSGAVNYLAEAKTVIAGIRESTIGPNSKLPMLGDWVEPGGINSTATYSQWSTRSSDFMPGHFRAFGAATGDTAYWCERHDRRAKRDHQHPGERVGGHRIAARLHPHRRLAPRSATGACQLSRRVDTMATTRTMPAATRGDSASTRYLTAIRPRLPKCESSLNGSAPAQAASPKTSAAATVSTARLLNTWEDTFFIAPFAVAAMTGSTAADQTWLNSLYSYIYQEPRHEQLLRRRRHAAIAARSNRQLLGPDDRAPSRATPRRLQPGWQGRRGTTITPGELPSARDLARRRRQRQWRRRCR